MVKHGMVSYLNNREIGNDSRSKKLRPDQHDAASVIAEQKATAPTKNMACELSGHSRSTFLITFSPNGQLIGSTHGDHTVRVSDVVSGRCLHVLKGHPRTPWSIAFHPTSNNLLASGCLEGHVRIWDLHGGGSELWKTPKGTVVTSLTFHPAGHMLLIATHNNILFWDWSQPQPFAECATRSVYGRVRWVQFDSLGRFLYTGISNMTSVYGEETEESSPPESDPSVRRGEANQLRDRYQMIVEQITSMQRDGVLSGTVADWHYPSRRPAERAASGQRNASSRPSSSRPSSSRAIGNDELLQQSPESIQSLENAARYASQVTRASRAALMMQRGAASDTQSIGAALDTSAVGATSDPMSGGAASDPTSSGPASYPLVVGAASDALSRGAASDPLSRGAPSDPLSRGAAWDQLSTRGAASNPLSRGAASDLSRGAAWDPMSRGAASDPLSRAPAWDPLSRGPAWDPLSRGAASDPLSRGAASNQLSRGAASNPLSRGAASDPLSRGAASNQLSRGTTSGSHSARVSRAMFDDAARSGAGTSSTPALSAVAGVMPSSSQLSDSTREMSVQSDAAVLSDDSEDSNVTTSSSDASLRSDADTSSSHVVASSDSRDSVYPRCSVQTRPALRRADATMSDAARTRHRMVLPPMLGECTPSSTVESHFSPVHRSHSSDDEAVSASNDTPTTSEAPRRTAASGSSGRAITFSGIHSRSAEEPRTQGGSTSVGRTLTSSSGEGSYQEVGSMRTRPRLGGATRTTASVGSSEERSLGTSATPQSQSQLPSTSSWQGSTWQGDWEPHRADVHHEDGSEVSLVDQRRWSGALQQRVWTMRRELARRRQERRETRWQRRWHVSPRLHLHPHYSVSILDDSSHGNGLQAAINRAIAGAFTARGEASVASNIDNLTHRIQRWDISSSFQMPDIDDSEVNIVVSCCKMHNDTSCDISKDGTLLATFVPSHHGFPDDTILGVFSLCPESLGQCIFTKSFGPNAISVSLSPLNNYVLIGLAAKRLAWVFTQQMVAQVYRLKTAIAGEDSMQHVCDLMHPCDADMQSQVSVNCACWMPEVGQGITYATNKGDLHICTPGYDGVAEKTNTSNEFNWVRQNLMQMLGMTVPRRMQQSVPSQRHTTGSQTDS